MLLCYLKKETDKESGNSLTSLMQGYCLVMKIRATNLIFDRVSAVFFLLGMRGTIGFKIKKQYLKIAIRYD